MRIDTSGQPTYVTMRHGKGIALIQGRSKVMLAPQEVGALLKALRDVAPAGGWTNNATTKDV